MLFYRIPTRCQLSDERLDKDTIYIINYIRVTIETPPETRSNNTISTILIN